MAVRTRREPPKFRRVQVRRVEQLTPRLRRVTFAGPELEGLVIDQPAASVRLLLPSPGTDELALPEWSGNLFLLPSGERATIRTFTPRRLDAASLELDLDIVIHGHGAASEWADSAAPGAEGAISGPARGYDVDDSAPAFLLGGDETAIPAMSQLLDVLPREVSVQVHVEVADPVAQVELPQHPRATVTWHVLRSGATPGSALVDAMLGADLVPEVRVWVAGEAASVQRVRKHFFTEVGMPRSQAAVRGYWKHGRAGDSETT
jgi:NADPH-dependent ferric siderophore reductase